MFAGRILNRIGPNGIRNYIGKEEGNTLKQKSILITLLVRYKKKKVKHITKKMHSNMELSVQGILSMYRRNCFLFHQFICIF